MTLAIDPAETERFRGLVTCRLGLQFDETRLGLLEDVLRRRSEATHQEPETYLAGLETDCQGDELGALAQELTVPETYFFRHLDQFHAFAEVALPDRMRVQSLTRTLRVLSAGCASGEEPYSLAITMLEAIADPAWRVSVRAVDVNPAIVERAVRGRYTSWALRETPPEIQGRWFHHDGGELVLDDVVRQVVEFGTRNLTADDPELWQPGRYDVIFCRNVLMYFTRPHAETLVARLTRSLAPGGFLFLGHAETLRGLSQQFHLCHTHRTFYYRRRERTDAEASRTIAWDADAEPAPAADSTPAATLVEGAQSWVDAIGRAAERIQALTLPPPTRVPPAVMPGPQWNLGLALDLLRTERFAESLEQVNRLPPESKCDPDVLLLRALLLAHGGDLAAAEPVCKHLLEIDELNAGAQYVLALCREGMGDCRGAADHDRAAIYLDPLFAMPRLHLGLLARRAGKRDAARYELGQALLLLQREDASRLLLFGGGFSREALIALCRAELDACGGRL